MNIVDKYKNTIYSDKALPKILKEAIKDMQLFKEKSIYNTLISMGVETTREATTKNGL